MQKLETFLDLVRQQFLQKPYRKYSGAEVLFQVQSSMQVLRGFNIFKFNMTGYVPFSSRMQVL